MLILARKRNQSLRIGDNIKITVIGIQGDQVRLGITAPQDVQVLRQELYEEISEANAQASRAAQDVNLTVVLDKIQKLGAETSKDEKK
ncbi:carbon storage regulator [Lucifera butyrica]|uniref:Translational regulator CsrA n=1 Tax=Lucifera butyrica TaxID=1351585 RepID=A0A498RDN8_9FIRM|nr:carbon storage regulator CsrA [Lucifera butyrica]VBB09439.1 carbon storage regulator [Lucifera butyrica]